MLSCATGGSSDNNFVFVFDYKHFSWWFWDGWNAHVFAKDEGPNDRETVYFTNKYGWIYQIGDDAHTDHGSTISSYVTTHRLGFGDVRTKSFRAVRINADSTTSSPSLSLFSDDVASTSSASVSLVDSSEVGLDTFALDADVLQSKKQRDRSLVFRTEGKHVKIKVAHNIKNRPFALNYLHVTAIPKGQR
jgi:hypothetical protein